MISFRYHLITIVAVFLAIALGIVMGASFVRGPLVNQLQSRTGQLATQLEDLRDQVDVLRQFGSEVFPHVVQGRLQDVPVVLLNQEGGRSTDLDRVRSAVTAAGATIEGTLTVSARILARDDASRRELADALGLAPGAVPEDVTAAAAGAIARRLALGLEGAPGQDILERLSDGFVTPSGVNPAALDGLGGFGSVLVVVGGGENPPSMEVDTFLLPLLRAYAEARPALAVQATDSEFPFVELVRAEDALGGRVSTVDDIEQVAGRTAIVLAAADLVAGEPPGDYGIDQGRDSLLPPVRTTPSP
jgi:hypothetical protein